MSLKVPVILSVFLMMMMMLQTSNACECTGQTVFLNGLQAGDCNTVGRNGRPWCYVNFDGSYSCGDETRAPVSGFYVSYNACDLQRIHGVVVPFRSDPE